MLQGDQDGRDCQRSSATNGGGSNVDDNDNVDNVDNDDDDDDDDDDGDDDNDPAAPADKWTTGKLFHWHPFFARTSGCH